jgi:hypothetical protein
MIAHDLGCVVHVHSTRSDGTATVPEIAADARATGADAVLVTDHDALARGEGWHGGVLVLAGCEVTLARGGHFLAFGIAHPIRHRGLDGAEVARAVAAVGGFGFAAHPFASGRLSPPGWAALHAPGVTGVEVWNVASDVLDRLRRPLRLVRFVLDPDRVLDHGPPAANLAAWDRLGAVRATVAIAGLDAHQPGLRVGRRVLSPVPNRRWFGALRTHLLLSAAPSGRLEADRELVLEALRGGRAWIHRPPAGPADGARLWLERPDGRQVPMGGEAPAERARLRVELPQRADVQVLRGGALVARRDGVRALELEVARPGPYRVQARVGGRAWLYSNPVYLRADWPVSQ